MMIARWGARDVIAPLPPYVGHSDPQNLEHADQAGYGAVEHVAKFDTLLLVRHAGGMLSSSHPLAVTMTVTAD